MNALYVADIHQIRAAALDKHAAVQLCPGIFQAAAGFIVSLLCMIHQVVIEYFDIINILGKQVDKAL